MEVYPGHEWDRPELPDNEPHAQALGLIEKCHHAW